MIYFYEDKPRSDIDRNLMIFYYDEEYEDPIYGIKRTRRYIDYGVNLTTNRIVILPNEQINCDKQGLIFDSDLNCYFMKKSASNIKSDAD